MIRLRRLVSATLLTVVAATALAGCGGSKSPAAAAVGAGSQGVTEIQFYHQHSGVAEEAVKKVVDEYNQSQNKVHVQGVFIPGSYDGLLEKLQALVASKQPLPDVTQSAFQYNQFMIDNLPVTPVSKLIDAEKFDTSDFYPSALNLVKDQKGQIWSLPWAVSTPIVYYNADQFKAAGLDPAQPPKTWDELRQAAQKLNTPAHNGIWLSPDTWVFQSMVESAGGRYGTDDGKQARFGEAPAATALQYLSDLVNVDKSMPMLKPDQANQAFQSGNLSIYVASTNALGSLAKNSKFDLRTAIFPTLASNPRRVGAGGNSLYIMTKDPARQQAAWDFIKFATGPRGTTIIAQGIGYMAVRKSAVDKPELLGDFLSKNKNARTSYDQVADMVPWYNYAGKSGTRINKLLGDSISAALLKQKEPAQALKDAANEANTLLAR